MRIWTIFLKTWREFLREPWVLGLTLVFAPFFVVLYWMWFQGSSTSYTLLVLNLDRGAQTGAQRLDAGAELLQALRAVEYADSQPLLRLSMVTARSQIDPLLRDRTGVAFIVIPADFSEKIVGLQSGASSESASVTFGGDLTNPYYPVASILALNAVDHYVQQITGKPPLVAYLEEPLGGSAVRTEFETYVPGVLIFSVIMLIFIAAMSAAREVENGTLRRLQITSMTALDLLGGISLALMVVGVASVLLTFLTAQALGFHSQGPVWVAALIGAVASLSIIGMGMLVAGFTGNVSQAFVVANFPLGLLMFFSGAIFPMPRVPLFMLGSREIGLYDILPPTHAVTALNKILTLGSGFKDVTYELGALTLLSLLYFGLGVWIFGRRHLR